MSIKANSKGEDRVPVASGEMNKTEENSKVVDHAETTESDTTTVDNTIAKDTSTDEKTANAEVTDEKAPDNTCTEDDGPYTSSQGSCP